jgi:hypothetical protein
MTECCLQAHGIKRTSADTTQGTELDLFDLTWKENSDGCPLDAPACWTVAAGSVCFAVEDDKDVTKGDVYGILWSKRPATRGAGGGVCVLTELHGLCPPAIWTAICWANGVLQCGPFAGRGSLWKVRISLSPARTAGRLLTGPEFVCCVGAGQ